MHCSKALLILAATAAFAADFNGNAALEFTRKAVAFGPRPPGSAANLKLQAYIEAQLKTLHCQVSFFRVHQRYSGRPHSDAQHHRDVSRRYRPRAGSDGAL
jgi:hypothetical protein